MVLPHTAEAGRRDRRRPGCCTIPICTRGSPRRSRSPTCRRRPRSAQALYAESQKPDNYSDKWLSRAFYIAATRHQKSFIAAYHARSRRAAVHGAADRRCGSGARSRTGARPRRAELASDWKDMQVPGNWESRGLPDFDGVVWFTRTFDWTGGGAPTTLSLGPVRNTGEVWVNGQSLTPAPFVRRRRAPAAAAGGGAAPQRPRHRPAAAAAMRRPPTRCPTACFMPGTNTITVRIQNQRNEAASSARRTCMYRRGRRQPDAACRHVEVSRRAADQRRRAVHEARAARRARGVHGRRRRGRRAGAALPAVAAQAPDVVLRLSVVPGQMKFDKTEFNVGAGPARRDRLHEPRRDAAQLRARRARLAARQSARRAIGSRRRRPVWRRNTCRTCRRCCSRRSCSSRGRRSRSSSGRRRQSGQYPYVCTFPAHWRTMNGILNVVANQPEAGEDAAARLRPHRPPLRAAREGSRALGAQPSAETVSSNQFPVPAS